MGPYGLQRQRKSPMRTYYPDLQKLHEALLMNNQNDQRFNCLGFMKEEPTYTKVSDLSISHFPCHLFYILQELPVVTMGFYLSRVRDDTPQ